MNNLQVGKMTKTVLFVCIGNEKLGGVALYSEKMAKSLPQIPLFSVKVCG